MTVGTNRMSYERGRTDVSRARTGMAKLLTKTVGMTRKLERRLDVDGGWFEFSARIDLEADPAAAVRVTPALLLRKARIHTIAVLRANKINNLHSLAVQMRPVLECAGQVAFLFHHTVIAPGLFTTFERAMEVVGNRGNADHYQWFRRRTKGEVSAKQLRDMEWKAQEAAAASFGASKPKRNSGRRFNQADKVASLPAGREWYRYLSDHFSHGTLADWRGPSRSGGVMTNGRVEDQFAFLSLMDYLAKQVAIMNAYAALCPIAGDADDHWSRWIEPTLAQWRDVQRSSNALRAAAIGGARQEPDGST